MTTSDVVAKSTLLTRRQSVEVWLEEIESTAQGGAGDD
jgi:hypothetical protein